MPDLNPGDLAPDFDLEADGGGRVSLADLKGAPAVVYFYPKDDTPGCTSEAQQFTELAGEFRKAGVRVVGVSKDTAKKHDKFKAKYGLDLTLAADADGAMCEAWGVWVEKTLYGRQYMGIERATFLLDREGRIARAWRKVKVKDHAADVLEAARAL
ncbi:MAG TPA: thioredoxin-dependent thiol peroxidase [Caulobacteraceae bacterium]